MRAHPHPSTTTSFSPSPPPPHSPPWRGSVKLDGVRLIPPLSFRSSVISGKLFFFFNLSEPQFLYNRDNRDKPNLQVLWRLFLMLMEKVCMVTINTSCCFFLPFLLCMEHIQKRLQLCPFIGEQACVRLWVIFEGFENLIKIKSASVVFIINS